MLYLLLLCLIVFFGYALGLVILNNTETAVNLIFMQAPEMNLGLLLIVSIVFGLFIGVIISILMFKVPQKHMEVKKLTKENKKLNSKVDEMTSDLDKVSVDKDMLEKMLAHDNQDISLHAKSQKLADESINND